MAVKSATPRQAAVCVVQTLRDAGHTAYFAGGCVRDTLLGIEPKDYDVATDARPERVRDLFRRSRYVGEAFGVCLVYPAGAGGVGGPSVEVATFRVEWGYQDGRRPDHVEFTDAQHDARRRDFTINGLFAEPVVPVIPAPSSLRSSGAACDRIIDYVGGVADLKAGVVRAIGNPDERFAEDYLRMLRAVRFAARLGFTIEPVTARAIRVHARNLARISRERIGQEVRMMLTPRDQPSRLAGDAQRPSFRGRAAALIQELQLDGPTLDDAHRDQPLPTLAALAPDADYPTALAAWMLDRHVGERVARLNEVSRFVADHAKPCVDCWRQALNLSNEERKQLSSTLDLAGRSAHWPMLGVAQRKRLLAAGRWDQAWMLLQALSPGKPLEVLEREAASMLVEGVVPPPLIGGHDLITLGLTPGPEFGRLLELAYDAQLEGRFSTREAAMAWLKEAVSG